MLCAERLSESPTSINIDTDTYILDNFETVLQQIKGVYLEIIQDNTVELQWLEHLWDHEN